MCDCRGGGRCRGAGGRRGGRLHPVNLPLQQIASVVVGVGDALVLTVVSLHQPTSVVVGVGDSTAGGSGLDIGY